MVMPEPDQRAAPRAAAALSHLEAYWRGLMRRGLPPARRDMAPGPIGPALPGAFVLDRPSPRAARIRLAGRALRSSLGRDARGLPMTALFDEADWRRLTALLEHGFSGGAPCRVPVADAHWSREIAGGMLLLPLRPNPGRPVQVIGALLHDLPRSPERYSLAGPARIGAPSGAALPLRLVRPE